MYCVLAIFFGYETCLFYTNSLFFVSRDIKCRRYREKRMTVKKGQIYKISRARCTVTTSNRFELFYIEILTEYHYLLYFTPKRLVYIEFEPNEE